MSMTTVGDRADEERGRHHGRSPGLAVFDLDGTLVRGDTLIPFLVSFARARRRPGRLAAMPLPLALYALRAISAHSAKQRLLEGALRGESATVIAGHAELFSSAWVSRRLRPGMMTLLREHQDAGDRVVLLSASPDIYVHAIARLLGIAEVVCTGVEFRDGRCLGRITGSNCKGSAKVERLQTHLGQMEAPDVSYAYGDSGSDLPLLRWVRSGYLVTRRGDLLPVT